MKTVAIVQARMGSTRLPGKVLLDLAGQPMLERCMKRLERAALIDEIVIATTTNPQDDAIVQFCTERSWLYYRGDEDDVLDRYYRAALQRNADLIVRITSDCPLIEPTVVDEVIDALLSRQPDIVFSSNYWETRTYPRGLDVAALLFSSLEMAWHEDKDPAWREHVTTFIEHNPDRFPVYLCTHTEDLSAMRWTVDTEDDLTFVRKIFGHFGDSQFGWQEVVSLLQRHPEWLEINRHVHQKEIGKS